MTAQTTACKHQWYTAYDQRGRHEKCKKCGEIEATRRKKPRYQVWYVEANSCDLQGGEGSFTISGLKTDTIYERDSLAANIEKFLNSLPRGK